MDTTTELSTTRPDGEMTMVGYVVVGLLLVVLLPLLPFLALAWVVYRLLGRPAGRAPGAAGE